MSIKYYFFTAEATSCFIKAHARHVRVVHARAVHAYAVHAHIYAHVMHTYAVHTHAMHRAFYLRFNSDMSTVAIINKPIFHELNVLSSGN
jgi:hypothetical protein